MTLISSITRKRFLTLFTITLFTPILTYISQQILHNSSIVSSILSVIDELFVIVLLLYSVIKGIIRLNIDIMLLIAFVFVGFIGGIKNHVPYWVLFLGAFNTIKPIIIYLCFKQFNFSCEDILTLFKWICFSFPFFLFFVILEIFVPNLKMLLGYGETQIAELQHLRFGLRPIGGIFKFTHITLFSTFFYFAYKFYLRKSRLYYYCSTFMMLITLRIKDILAFVMVNIILLCNKIRVKTIILISICSVILITAYSIFLPEHYEQYFSEDTRESTARPMLYITSVAISLDYIPFGVGFGRFASPTSQDIESPVYSEYGINRIYGLNYDDSSDFMSDTFWPMILGETGIMGVILYLIIMYRAFAPFLGNFFKRTKDLSFLMPSMLFIIALIASVAKPTFSGPPNSFFTWGIAAVFFNIAFNTKQKFNKWIV